MAKSSRGKSVSVKSLHAAIDELAAARRLEELTALGTILMALARMDAEDGSDELELDTAIDGEDEKPARGKKVAGKKSAKDDEEEEEDDELDGLNDLDEDEDEKPARGKKAKPSSKKSKEEDEEDDDKPARGRRGKKVVEEEEEEELPALPAKWNSKKFDAFLDEIDQCTGEQFGESFDEYNKMGIRELTAVINGFGVDPVGLMDGLKVPAGREGRIMKTEVFAHNAAKYVYLTEQLVGCDYLESVAENYDLDTDDFGKGRTRNKKIAEAIVSAIYGGEEE